MSYHTCPIFIGKYITKVNIIRCKETEKKKNKKEKNNTIVKSQLKKVSISGKYR